MKYITLAVALLAEASGQSHLFEIENACYAAFAA